MYFARTVLLLLLQDVDYPAIPLSHRTEVLLILNTVLCINQCNIIIPGVLVNRIYLCVHVVGAQRDLCLNMLMGTQNMALCNT